MKTKILKFVLPAFAILLAISLSFATETDSFSNTGYIEGPTGAIPVQVDCNNTTQDQCYYLGQEVFQDTGLSIPLKKSQ